MTMPVALALLMDCPRRAMICGHRARFRVLPARGRRRGPGCLPPGSANPSPRHYWEKAARQAKDEHIVRPPGGCLPTRLRHSWPMTPSRPRVSRFHDGTIEPGARGPILPDEDGLCWRLGFVDECAVEVSGRVRVCGRIDDVDRIEVEYVEMQLDLSSPGQLSVSVSLAFSRASQSSGGLPLSSIALKTA